MSTRTRKNKHPHPSLLALALQAALAGLAMPGAASAQAANAEKEQPTAGTTMPVVRAKASKVDESAQGPVGGFVARRSATATKTDTPLAETPRSVSVITREQIEALKPISLQEALGYTPGIFAPPLASSVDSTSGLAIRGFRTSDGDAYYQDGLRAKFPGWWSYTGHEPYAFERIELLRGPASILYGQGQPNGTINMVSKRPPATPLREVGIEFGRFDRKQLTADIGGPLDERGEWRYRVTALAREGSTQIDHAQDNRYFFAGALAWKPTAHTELILRTSFQRNEGEPNNNLPAAGTLLPNANGVIPRHRAIGNDNDAHYDSKNIGWQFEHQASEVWTLRSNMRLNQTTGERRMTRNNGYREGQQRVIDRGVANYWSMDGNYNLVLDNHAQAQFKLGRTEHTLLLGVDYARQQDGWQVGGGSAGPVDLFAPVYTPATYNSTAGWERTANDRQLGAYVQDQVKIDQRWVLSAGARKDWAKNWTRSGTPGANEDSSRQKDNELSWQAGAAYLAGGGVTPYVSYAESFVPTLGTNYFGTAFKPETGRQYEAGVKYQPAGRNTLITAAVFDIRRQNLTTTDPAEPLNQIQQGEVASRGFELEARAELWPRFNLIGSYAYTRTKVTRSNDAELGKELIQSPRHAASLWVDSALGEGWLDGLSIGAGLRHTGRTWADTANTSRVPAYTLADLSMRYDLGRASASLKGAQAYLTVKNLTDKTYMTCFFGNCLYGQERMVTTGVRYAW